MPSFLSKPLPVSWHTLACGLAVIPVSLVAVIPVNASSRPVEENRAVDRRLEGKRRCERTHLLSIDTNLAEDTALGIQSRHRVIERATKRARHGGEQQQARLEDTRQACAPGQ